jgi:hypothetical protein
LCVELLEFFVLLVEAKTIDGKIRDEKDVELDFGLRESVI